MGLHILVLAGGSGTRLWPLSRRAVPKHLLPLMPDGGTLLRTTVERVIGLGQDVSVVTAAAYADQCREALAGLDLGPRPLILEPTARGTGPALGLANELVLADDPDAIVCSVHADHHIDSVDAYRAAVIAAAGWASSTDGLATVGIAPTHPATGFGYIELGDERQASDWHPPAGLTPDNAAAAAALTSHISLGFREKPSAETASAFVADGRHLWNLGLFAWPARRFQAELCAADPALAEALAAVATAVRAGLDDASARRYSALPSVPIEPLVFERTPQLTVVTARFSWSDLGSWADLYSVREHDAAGNAVEGDVITVDASGCLIAARGGRMVTVVGASNLVVVDTGDAVLVMPLEQSQLVKHVVDELAAQGRNDLT